MKTKTESKQPAQRAVGKGKTKCWAALMHFWTAAATATILSMEQASTANGLECYELLIINYKLYCGLKGREERARDSACTTLMKFQLACQIEGSDCNGVCKFYLWLADWQESSIRIESNLMKS